MKTKQFERILKALANKRRLAILYYLKRNKEVSVGEIAEAIHLSLHATSKHLSKLASVDIVDKEQHSLQMIYRISIPQHPIVHTVISLLSNSRE